MMRSIRLQSMIGVFLAFGAADAIPARPSYQPSRPPAQLVNLSGSAWLGKIHLQSRIYTFEADGTLTIDRVHKNRGSWKQEGNLISFTSINTKTGQVVMEFRGQITDARTIVGEADYPDPDLGIYQSPQTMKREANG